ncbi:hypothetical protein, partial [Streptomyces sp. NPDC058728]
PSADAKADPSALARPDSGRTAARDRVRMTVRNRRAASWTLPADRWAAGKAATRVIGTVRGWGYEHPGHESIGRSVELLVGAAVADGGKRVSVHAADQDDMILIVVLSHRAGPAPDDDAFLTRIAAVSGTASCGSDAGEDGRRVWSLLDTRPRRFSGAAPAGRPGQD